MPKCRIRIFDPLTGNFWEWPACRSRREIRRGMVVPLSELVPAVPQNLGIYVKLSPHCTPAERLHIAGLAAKWWEDSLAAARARARKASRPRGLTGHVVPRRPKRTKLNAHGWGFAKVGCAVIDSDQERAIENLAFAGDIQKGE